MFKHRMPFLRLIGLFSCILIGFAILSCNSSESKKIYGDIIFTGQQYIPHGHYYQTLYYFYKYDNDYYLGYNKIGNEFSPQKIGNRIVLSVNAKTPEESEIVGVLKYNEPLPLSSNYTYSCDDVYKELSIESNVFNIEIFDRVIKEHKYKYGLVEQSNDTLYLYNLIVSEDKRFPTQEMKLELAGIEKFHVTELDSAINRVSLNGINVKDIFIEN